MHGEARRMPWVKFCACLLFLAACGGPSPHFRDRPATRVMIGGDVFDVRVRGRLAEAVRRNPRAAFRLADVGAGAERAMALMSGCDVTEIRGDAAMVLGLLDCGSSAPRDGSRPGPESCEILQGWRQLGGEELVLVLDCERV